MEWNNPMRSGIVVGSERVRCYLGVVCYGHDRELVGA